MNPLRHKKTRAVFKSVLFLIGISLFTAQVSYKFYALSSRPVYHQVAANADLHHYDHRLSLSLDKRYKVQKVVAFPTPVFRLDGHPLASRPEQVFDQPPVLELQLSDPVLRGPPCA